MADITPADTAVSDTPVTPPIVDQQTEAVPFTTKIALHKFLYNILLKFAKCYHKTYWFRKYFTKTFIKNAFVFAAAYVLLVLLILETLRNANETVLRKQNSLLVRKEREVVIDAERRIIEQMPKDLRELVAMEMAHATVETERDAFERYEDERELAIRNGTVSNELDYYPEYVPKKEEPLPPYYDQSLNDVFNMTTIIEREKIATDLLAKPYDKNGPRINLRKMVLKIVAGEFGEGKISVQFKMKRRPDNIEEHLNRVKSVKENELMEFASEDGSLERELLFGDDISELTGNNNVYGSTNNIHSIHHNLDSHLDFYYDTQNNFIREAVVIVTNESGNVGKNGTKVDRFLLFEESAVDMKKLMSAYLDAEEFIDDDFMTLTSTLAKAQEYVKKSGERVQEPIFNCFWFCRRSSNSDESSNTESATVGTETQQSDNSNIVAHSYNNIFSSDENTIPFFFNEYLPQGFQFNIPATLFAKLRIPTLEEFTNTFSYYSEKINAKYQPGELFWLKMLIFAAYAYLFWFFLKVFIITEMLGEANAAVFQELQEVVENEARRAMIERREREREAVERERAVEVARENGDLAEANANPVNNINDENIGRAERAENDILALANAINVRVEDPQVEAGVVNTDAQNGTDTNAEVANVEIALPVNEAPRRNSEQIDQAADNNADAAHGGAGGIEGGIGLLDDNEPEVRNRNNNIIGGNNDNNNDVEIVQDDNTTITPRDSNNTTETESNRNNDEEEDSKKVVVAPNAVTRILQKSRHMFLSSLNFVELLRNRGKNNANSDETTTDSTHQNTETPNNENGNNNNGNSNENPTVPPPRLQPPRQLTEAEKEEEKRKQRERENEENISNFLKLCVWVLLEFKLPWWLGGRSEKEDEKIKEAARGRITPTPLLMHGQNIDDLHGHNGHDGDVQELSPARKLRRMFRRCFVARNQVPVHVGLQYMWRGMVLSDEVWRYFSFM